MYTSSYLEPTSSEFKVEICEAPSLWGTNRNNEVDSEEKCIKIEIPDNIIETMADRYTMIEKACIENRLDMVKLLVEDYKLSPNVEAADEAQPLVIAGLLGHLDIVEILLKANANVDAEFGEEVQLKFAKDGVSCNDFGDKITLAIFAVMNNKNDLMDVLIKNSNPYLKFISKSNKTLLMYAIEKDNYENANVFTMLQDKEFINIRDNDGISAIHYIIHKSKYGEFRYDQKQLLLETEKLNMLADLIDSGANIYSTANDDPLTFLLNAAAYRGSCAVINHLLHYYSSIKQSKALYYATLPITDPDKYLRPDNEESSLYELEISRHLTIKFILKDLINRRTFGFFVPEEEKKLMDKLIDTDTDIKNMVMNHEKSFIHGSLKNTVIEYGDKRITLFDFVMKVSDSDKNLQDFVRDESFVEKFSHIYYYDDVNFLWFFSIYTRKIEKAQERIEIMKKLKNISQLRKLFPLPYKAVLQIIYYLNNYDLQKFINSFFVFN